MKRPAVEECLIRVKALLRDLSDVRQGRCSKRRRVNASLPARSHLVAIVTELAQDQNHHVFAAPADIAREKLPDFLASVARPIDLATIRMRLEADSIGYYKGALHKVVTAFYGDLNQILTNARGYWGDSGQHVVRRAEVLEKCYDAALVEFLELRAEEEFVRRLRKLAGNSTVLQYLKSQAEASQEEGLHSDRLEGRLEMTTSTINQLEDTIEMLMEKNMEVGEEVADMVRQDPGFLSREPEDDDDDAFSVRILSSATQWKMWYSCDRWRAQALNSEATAPPPQPQPDPPITAPSPQNKHDIFAAAETQEPSNGNQWDTCFENPFGGAEEQDNDFAAFKQNEAARTTSSLPLASPGDRPAQPPALDEEGKALHAERMQAMHEEVGANVGDTAGELELNRVLNEWGKDDWRVDSLQFPNGTPGYPGGMLTAPSPQVHGIPGQSPTFPGPVIGMGGGGGGGGGGAVDVAESPAFGDQLPGVVPVGGGGGGGAGYPAVFLSPRLAPSLTPGVADLSQLPSPRHPG